MARIDWSRVPKANGFGSDKDPKKNEHGLDPTMTGVDEYPANWLNQKEIADLRAKIPPPNRRDSQGGGNLGVSTQALKTFASHLRTVKDMLAEPLARLKKVDIAPGAFYDAYQMLLKFRGSGPGSAGGPTSSGLVQPLIEFLQKAVEALEVTAQSVEKLARDYQNAEELNSLTSTKLGEHIREAVNYISSTTGLQENVLLPSGNPLNLVPDNNGTDVKNEKTDVKK
ncbi:hypothetical protein [Saccharothrix sp. Mg75]|uniref:hypothetical protein n=1 Tax=Saccharothrix sp. Mg75 TaxID=3445357 RepID=UPI003EEFD3F7